MEPEAGRIVVWVGQEEKLVYGLSKHTTSADIVQVLLEEQQAVIGNRRVKFGDPKEFYITIKWKGSQCTLPPTIQMRKLWKAWGAEKVNISFFLTKSEPIQPSLIWNTGKFYKQTKYEYHSTASVIKTFPLHKQKNIVRKAFRKLAEMKKGMDVQEKNSIKNLVQVIASQDLIIKKQINRMQELDEQTEECKTYLHLDKEEAEEHSAHCHLKEDEFTQHRCKFSLDTDSPGELLYVKDEINSPYIHIENSSNEIKEEPMTVATYQREDMCASQEDGKDNLEMCMLQSLRQAVDESIQLGVQLHSLFSCIQQEIHHHDSVLLKQEIEYDVLKEELKLLNSSNHLVTSKSLQSYNSSSTGSKEELSNTIGALSCMTMAKDTDSDTGISSTNSQNSDPVT